MTKSKRFIENRMESYRIRRHRGFQNETKHSKQKRFKFLSKERLCNGLALRGSKLSTSQHFRSQNKLLCSCLKCPFSRKNEANCQSELFELVALHSIILPLYLYNTCCGIMFHGELYPTKNFPVKAILGVPGCWHDLQTIPYSTNG